MSSPVQVTYDIIFFVLFHNLGLLKADPLAFLEILLGTVIALAVAITVHEFSHAFLACHLGDETPRRMGRLSLNPLVHLDPIGTILLFIVGFGWGKPVPVTPYYLRGGARKGMAKVAFAGPLAGLIAAAFFGLLFRSLQLPWLSSVLFFIIFYNIVLSLFNLIPLPPLDGFHVLQGMLPREMAYSLSRLESYGPMLLIFIIFIDSFSGLNILWRVLMTGVEFFSWLFIGREIVF